MTRRAFLRLAALLPFPLPLITKALAHCDKKAAVAYTPYLPAVLPKWNKAIDGLDDAALWVLDIERSQMPKDLVFPRVGQIWETTRDCEVGLHGHMDLGRSKPDVTK